MAQTKATSSQVTGLAASATTDTTNASNITSGSLPNARLANNSITINGTSVSLGGSTTLKSSLNGMQVFTSSGTFTIPSGVTAVKVTLVGGGGGGGAGQVQGTGGGGGAGGIGISYLTGLTPGATLSITVGSGGTSGQGNSGGASSVSSGTQSISTITANGGTGGNNNTGSGGGLGASGSVSGAQLGITTGSPTYYNISAYGHYDGNGLTNGWGIGGRVQTAGYGVGGNASGYGSGGGGGVQSNSVGWVNGGSGSNGVVIFEY